MSISTLIYLIEGNGHLWVLQVLTSSFYRISFEIHLTNHQFSISKAFSTAFINALLVVVAPVIP
jgi:flagellar biosynthesis protein FliR